MYGSGGRYVTTDNAYVKQDRVDVAPQVAGDVREVFVGENARARGRRRCWSWTTRCRDRRRSAPRRSSPRAHEVER